MTITPGQDYWEDRLARDGKHPEAVAALARFRKSRKGRVAQDILYEALTNLGVTAEEADEIVNLELQE